MDRTAKSIGGRLDQLLRKCRGGQTVGISIGPDTSWLISEVVLGRVDAALQKRHPETTLHALRWVDDMVFYAGSHNLAEEVLGHYEEELAAFGLALNPAKTAIQAGIKPYHDEWLIRLRQARYRDDKETHQADDILDLFSIAFTIQEKQPYSGAISYAIKRCNPFPVGKGWLLFQDLLLASIALESSSIRHVFDIVSYANDSGIDIDRTAFEAACSELILRHAPLDHGFEVSWLLLMLREIGIEPSTDCVEAALLMQCNASNLLAWAAANESARLKRECSNTHWVVKRAEAANALQSEDWLLAYEARVRRWCSAKRWEGSSAWQEMKDAKVQFMDIRDPSSPRVKRRRIQRLRPAFASTWGS